MLSPNVDFVTQCEVGIGDPLTTVTSGQRLRLPEEDGAGTQELDLNSLVFCLLLVLWVYLGPRLQDWNDISCAVGFIC